MAGQKLTFLAELTSPSSLHTKNASQQRKPPYILYNKLGKSVSKLSLLEPGETDKDDETPLY